MYTVNVTEGVAATGSSRELGTFEEASVAAGADNYTPGTMRISRITPPSSAASAS
jgi:hypothetical protein